MNLVLHPLSLFKYIKGGRPFPKSVFYGTYEIKGVNTRIYKSSRYMLTRYIYLYFYLLFIIILYIYLPFFREKKYKELQKKEIYKERKVIRK